MKSYGLAAPAPLAVTHPSPPARVVTGALTPTLKIKVARTLRVPGGRGRGLPRAWQVRIGSCALCARWEGGGDWHGGGVGVHCNRCRKKANEKRTAPSVPKWSPTSVLAGA